MNRQVAYRYDNLNRLTNIAYPDGSKAVFSHDANGNAIRMESGSVSNGFGYDKLNALAVSTARVGVASFAIAYQRDAGGFVTNLVYPGGLSVRYEYNAEGGLVSVKDWNNRTFRQFYDYEGRVAWLSYTGATWAMSYDATVARLYALRTFTNERVAAG